MLLMSEPVGHQQGLLRVVVAVAEVEVLLAVGRDGHRAGPDVALAGVQRQAALQRVEGGVLDHELEVHALRDLRHDVDVEALEAGGGALVEVLERRVGHVGADGERAVGDELAPAGGGAGVATAATGGEREGEERQGHEGRRTAIRHDQHPRTTGPRPDTRSAVRPTGQLGALWCG